MQGFSIVVTSRNRHEALAKLIPELLELQGPDKEIIVVDNASTDPTRETVLRFPVKYIYFPGGLGEARHIGSLAASGEFITYVDDDTRPGDPAILKKIAGAFERNPKAGIIGCRIENIGFKGMQQFKGYTKFGKNAVLEFESNPPAADVFASMAITVRKDVYQVIGGFDPAFSRGCEEVDLCMKVKAAGFELIHYPEAFFYHYEMGSHFRFNPIHNRDYMRLYSFFKFFPPTNIGSWIQFVKNEWSLFVGDVAQIYRQYSTPDFRSTHLPVLNKLLSKSRTLRALLRWPLMFGAILVSPLLRRLFIPYIYWKAKRRIDFERLSFGLNYA